MKLQASCLLLCSLTAFCEDARVVPELRSAPTPAVRVAQERDGKLEWNVEPAYWEDMVDQSDAAAITGPSSDNPASGGLFASQFGLSPRAGVASDGTMKEAEVERILQRADMGGGLRLGQSDYVFRSPILEGLVPRRSPADASLGRKFLNLPIVRWFVPLPMPEPPGGGKYFRWGERDQSWAESSRPIPGPRALDNGM